MRSVHCEDICLPSVLGPVFIRQFEERSSCSSFLAGAVAEGVVVETAEVLMPKLSDCVSL